MHAYPVYPTNNNNCHQTVHPASVAVPEAPVTCIIQSRHWNAHTFRRTLSHCCTGGLTGRQPYTTASLPPCNMLFVLPHNLHSTHHHIVPLHFCFFTCQLLALELQSATKGIMEILIEFSSCAPSIHAHRVTCPRMGEDIIHNPLRAVQESVITESHPHTLSLFSGMTKVNSNECRTNSRVILCL